MESVSLLIRIWVEEVNFIASYATVYKQKFLYGYDKQIVFGVQQAF